MVSSPHKRFDMKELKCPKCGNVFQVDEADICSGLSYYSNIHILKSLKMKKYLAEMVGTMVLVLMGCGVAVSLGCDPVNNIPAVVGTAFAFGLSVVAMAYTIGGISGCHINPAITLGVTLS